MKPVYYLFLALLLGSLSACQPRMYFAERVNSPGFKEANEFKATFSGKLQTQKTDSSKTTGGGFSPDVDLAYSFTNHFAVLASYRDLLNKYIGEQTLDPAPTFANYKSFGGMFNGNYGEAGAGYFMDFKDRGRFEVFAGYGTGTIKRTSFTTQQYDYTAHYNRFFVQPAVGYSSDGFNVMGGLKVIMQKYSDFQSANPDLQYFISTIHGTAPTTDVTRQFYTFISPFVNMEMGYKYARFNFQTGFSNKITGGYIAGTLPLYVNVGATFNYAPRYFKKTKATTGSKSNDGPR